MLAPTVDAFTALARSSPWRWSTLRFTLRWGRGPAGLETVRAWLRRPDRLRVETPDGELVQIVHEQSGAARPVDLRPDGLVLARSREPVADAPMFQNYFWVALLDPVELSEGIEIEDVRAVEHAGRPAWQAVVRPSSVYEPRCGCCSLLRSREIDLLEFADHPQHILSTYPDAYRVRLDVGTGVCVYTEEVGGLTPGEGHDVRIQAVDEPMDDDLFVQPPRGPIRWGWNQYPGPT